MGFYKKDYQDKQEAADRAALLERTGADDVEFVRCDGCQTMNTVVFLDEGADCDALCRRCGSLVMEAPGAATI